MKQAVLLLFVATLLGAGIAVAAASGVPPASGFGQFAGAPRSGLAATEPRGFDSDLRLPGIRLRESEHQILLRNTDALVGTKVWLTPASARSTFVYVDVGATDSALRWQGLAGVHGSHGIDLLGGWRHVTFHDAPGSGFTSIDFDGPFLGATLAF